MPKLKFHNPALPKGELVEIPGVGAVENGSEIEITKEQQDAFEALEGWKLEPSKDGNLGGKPPEPPKAEKEEEGGED